MIAFLLALTLAQASPALQSDNGTVSGVLKASDGKPVAGVRVAAMLAPESTANAAAAAAMVSLAASDGQGRYRLENIPPGRYYIVAGRVDFPTYFPGGQNMSEGTIVSVTAKANLSGLDFALKDASFRLAGINNTDSFVGLGGLVAQPSLNVPVQVVVENGIRQPVSDNGKLVTLILTRVSDGARDEIPLVSSSITAPLFTAAIGAEYRVTVENLPNGYVVKSLTYRTLDLLADALKLDSSNFQQLTLQNFPVGTTFILRSSSTGTVVTVPLAINATGNAISPGISGTANSNMVVMLAANPSASTKPGARITGKVPVSGAWSIFRGITPGTVFADGTFEFTGVPAGRHIVVLQDATGSRFYAAFVSVDDRDVDGVTLDSAGVLPNNPNWGSTAAIGASGARPLAGLLGRVFEEDSGKPLNRGMVTVLGQSIATISIGADGKFIIPRLVPGSYDLRIEAFEHFTLYQTIDIADEDRHVDFKIRSNLSRPSEQ